MLVIPRRTKIKDPADPKAIVAEKSATHVTGWFYTYETTAGFRRAVPRYFAVKHDGQKFSVGSGSGKMTFWFSDDTFHDQNEEP
jgi:hypothetical protein